MNDASITIVGLANPPNAVLMSTTWKITISRHARSGGAPNGSLSATIRIIIRTVMASAIIIGVVMC